MLYKVTADLSFGESNKGQIASIQNFLSAALDKAVNINEGLTNQETSFIEVRECNHDDPARTTPDKVLARYEAGKGRVI